MTVGRSLLASIIGGGTHNKASRSRSESESSYEMMRKIAVAKERTRTFSGRKNNKQFHEAMIIQTQNIIDNLHLIGYL